jgi:non-heme chloroperoxidase
MVRTTRWGKRLEEEVQDAPAQRRAARHDASPLDGCAAALCRTGGPTGEAIIFLHGYSDSWFSFSRVLPLLSAEYHAFALTQRGQGDSDKPDCCYTPDDFAADVDAFMDAVGVEETTLVGASTGALFS